MTEMRVSAAAVLEMAGPGNREEPVFWCFRTVEAALIRAMRLWWRLPDREASWLGSQTMGLWRQAVPEWGDYVWSGERPRQPGLTRGEVAEMQAVFAWVETPAITPADRRLIGLAIRRLAAGGAQVPWLELRAPMGIARGADGLRKRYGRAVNAICRGLNTGKLKAI